MIRPLSRARTGTRRKAPQQPFVGPPADEQFGPVQKGGHPHPLTGHDSLKIIPAGIVVALDGVETGREAEGIARLPFRQHPFEGQQHQALNRLLPRVGPPGGQAHDEPGAVPGEDRFPVDSSGKMLE